MVQGYIICIWYICICMNSICVYIYVYIHIWSKGYAKSDGHGKKIQRVKKGIRQRIKSSYYIPCLSFNSLT